MYKYVNLLFVVFFFSTELLAVDTSSKHMTVKHQKYFTGEVTQLEAHFVGQPVRIRNYYIDFEAHLGQLMGEPTITSHFKFSFTDTTEIIVGDGTEQVVLRSGWSVGQDGKGYIIPKEQWKKIRITGASYVANIDSHHSIIAQTPGLMGRNGEWSQDIPASPTWGTLLYSPNFTQSTLWMNKAEPDYQHLKKTWKHATAEEVKKYVLGNFGKTLNSGLYLFDVVIDLWPTVPVMERNYPAYLGDLLGTKQYSDPINRQAQAMINQANYYADSSSFSKRAQITDKWFKQFGNRVNQKIKDAWVGAKSRPQELRAEVALNELMSSIDKMGNVKEIPKSLLIKLQATAKKVEAVSNSSHVHAMLAKAKGLLGKEPKKLVKAQAPTITDPVKTLEWKMGDDSYKYHLSGKFHAPRNILEVTAKARVIQGTNIKAETPIVISAIFTRQSKNGIKKLEKYELSFSVKKSTALKKQCLTSENMIAFIKDIHFDNQSMDGGRTAQEDGINDGLNELDYYYEVRESQIDINKLTQTKTIRIPVAILFQDYYTNRDYPNLKSPCENVELEIDATGLAAAIKQIVKLPFTTTKAPVFNGPTLRLHRAKKQ